ncbi:hypothetical protein [Pantoea septica]|uniref:hypothetical protein n=1 Tax=Pantoea septica TaxID=472695 RepID=UPI0023F72928|nr:hypothetical protein [Pantoea septica]
MFAKLFSRKRHFFNVCLLTPAGARSVIVSYPDRLMTAARLYLIAQGEGQDTDCTVLAHSYMGKMTEEQAKTRI